MILMCPVCQSIFFSEIYEGDECPNCMLGQIIAYNEAIVIDAIETSEEELMYERLLKQNSKTST